MTAITMLHPPQYSTTRRELRRMLLRTALGGLALTAGLYASVPVAMTGGPVAFTLFSIGSAVLTGLLLKGRLRTHSICQFLGTFLLCGALVLTLWDVAPEANILLFGAAQADSVLLALFTQLLYSVFAFFAMLLTLVLRRHEDDELEF